MKITETLAEWVLELEYSSLPQEVIKEGKKSLLNWLGVTIGASRHPSVDMILDLAGERGSREEASILGRKEKRDLLYASLINGMSSHIFDFDDTHLETVLHPSSPVAPVVFALGEKKNLTGEEVLLAFLAGVEVECSIAKAIYPDHYDRGWHITSTVGNFGAAAAAGKILGLNVSQLTQALGLAATQASGLREMFGTMTKPFHPGKAAFNGLLASLLAQKGFTSSLMGIEAKAGFANVLSTKQDYEPVTRGLGVTWEILNNSYKPFACGVVAHPTIDALIRIGKRTSINSHEIKEIKCQVNRLVPILMGKERPKTGLESKFSTYHCAAVGFLFGKAGEEEFSEERVLSQEVVSLREKVQLFVDANIKEDEAIVEVIKKDGSSLKEHVRHAVGSKDHPMGEEDLEEKFREITRPILSEDRIERLIKTLNSLEKVKNLLDVTILCS